MKPLWVIFVVLLALAGSGASTVSARRGPSTRPHDAPEAGRASASFDVATATRAYFGRLTPEERERSDAYFQGHYALNHIYESIIFARIETAMRWRAEHLEDLP